MIKFIYALFLAIAFCIYSKGQNKTQLPKADTKSENKDVIAADSIERTNKINDRDKRWKINDYRLPAIDTESASQGVIVQNSLPKGDRHTDSKGKNYGIAIFWSRVINETDSPIELTINFSADSLEIISSPDSYLKLFLPSDTMTLDKVGLYNYGVTDLTSYLDHGLDKPTMLRRTINPKEAYLFYVGVVRYQVPHQGPGRRRPGLRQAGGGATRTALVLKEGELFYRVSIDHQSTLIPCGRIVFKK